MVYFAVCCFRSEVVGVLIDMVMPGMVTEFHDMGGLGKPLLVIVCDMITELTTTITGDRVHSQRHSIPRQLQRRALLALSLR